MRTFKRILGVLLIFIFGVVVGSVLTTGGALQKAQETLLGGPEAVLDVVVKRLDHKLKLDDEQKRKLQGILDDARIKLRQSNEKVRPEVAQTLREAEERTRAILYPDQVKKFDEMVSKSREKWKAMERPAAGSEEPRAPSTSSGQARQEPSGSATTPKPSTPASSEDGAKEPSGK